MKREFGDFQTPPALVDAVLDRLLAEGQRWGRVLEPTCGSGHFITGLQRHCPPPDEVLGFDLNPDYVAKAAALAGTFTSTQVRVAHANFFALDLRHDLPWRTTGPLLVVGNPPWVTNAELGVLGSANLPTKHNIKGLTGLDARTGSANFDLAESIWLKLLKELASEQPTIALLCKTSVARNVLQFAHDQRLGVVEAAIYRIDAARWFGVAVDACLFRVTLGSGAACYEAPVYASLEDTAPETVIGFITGRMVRDLRAYMGVAAADGSSTFIWRQGVKHDAASCMELLNTPLGLRNKLGEGVKVEDEYVYPLLKGSDLFHWQGSPINRRVILPQRRLGEDTHQLATIAPQLWRYLDAHAEVFARRKSSIYTHQPPYSIFGIGDYSFAPYKVAVSGLHKIPRFRAIGLTSGQPVMLDDTCYFIPCQDARQAALLATLLNHQVAQQLIAAISFPDAKRPITKGILERIDLAVVLEFTERDELLQSASPIAARLGGWDEDKVPWPEDLGRLLEEGTYVVKKPHSRVRQNQMTLALS